MFSDEILAFGGNNNNDSGQPLSLYLAAHLTYGCVKIYQRQIEYLYGKLFVFYLNFS